MISEATTNVFSEAIAIAIPQSNLRVSEWAAAHRFLPPERSALPGRWRNEVVPYLVEIMDSVIEPGVRKSLFVKSAQIGGTEAGNNIVGYFMHIDPSPILYVMETEGKAQDWSKESLAPMIRDTPALANIVSEARSRDSGNTIGDKKFPGGHLAIGHATSAATLSSRPRRVVILDEADAYKTTSEGDPAKLAEARTKTFIDDSIVFVASTPRNRLDNPEGSPVDAPRYTPIERDYENSDKRKYWLPCPHCDEYQVLEWSRVRWDSADTVLDAYYVCVNGCVIDHEEKAGMLARGKWIAEKPFKGTAGFLIWEGYSPFVTWGEMVANFLNSKSNRDKLKVFVNTSLAEGWEDPETHATVDDLESRREDYANLLPDGVLVLTAGVDVQGDRLEPEIIGWGLDEENWSIDYEILYGDPAQPAVWLELKEFLTREFEFEIPLLGSPDDASIVKSMRVACAMIDSGGFNTDQVYGFCRKNAGRRWYACKGANTPGKPLITKPSLQGRPPIHLYTIGTEAAKDTIAGQLLVTEPGPGFCHFPTETERAGIAFYGEDYFKQLRSEHVVTRPSRGVSVRRWEKIRPGARNEALDRRVYAMAAMKRLNPDFHRLLRLREIISTPAEPLPPEQVAGGEDEQFEIPGSPSRGRRRGGGRNFATSWKG